MKTLALITLSLLTVEAGFSNTTKPSKEKDSREEITKAVNEFRKKHGITDKKPGFYEKSEFDVIPLNSPVKDGVAKFLIKTPPKFEIQQLSYRLHNSTDLLEKNKMYEVGKLVEGAKGKELHVPMTSYNSGFYKLYVKIKTKKDKDKELQFRSAYNEHVKFIFEKQANPLPTPDPELNDSTLLGIDSDNDGVRDDLQLWVNQSYPPATYPSTNNALKQILRYYQLFLENADNEAEAMPYYIKSLESMQCLNWIHLNGYKVHKEIVSRAINTPERIKAYLKVELLKE